MIKASCHCGSVTLDIAAAPTEVTDCNCSICRRYGVLWAYYSPTQVTVSAREPTDTYMWDDRSIVFHRCANCGCVSHWSPVDPARDAMGVNARLMDPATWPRLAFGIWMARSPNATSIEPRRRPCFATIGW